MAKDFGGKGGVDHSANQSTATWPWVDADRSALHRLGHRRVAALIAACVLLFVGIRSINLDADPPTSFGKRPKRELVAEPAAKSHEARNYALFGEFHLNDADDYQFWRAQSPAWVYPLTAFFSGFGVDWPQLRLFSTLYAALGVLAVLLIAVRFATPLAVAFIGGLLVFDSMYFHYSRAGLIEPAVNSWIAGGMLALILAERRLAWLIVAHWALAIAFFTKQAGLVAVPVVAVATALLFWRARAEGPTARRERLAVVANAGLIVALSAVYILNSDYWRAVEHNFGHVLLGSDAPARNKYSGFASAVTRIFKDGRYRQFFGTLPVTGPLAIGASIAVAYAAFRSRRLPYPLLVMVGWFVCSFGAMLAIAWPALRFWTMVVLPAALVTGLTLDWIYILAQRHGWTRVFKPVAIGCAVILFGIHGFVLREPLFKPRYTFRDGANAIVQAIGDVPATVMGARSPPMVLGTPYKNFYLRSMFNQTRTQLQNLAPTHFLFVRGGDGSQRILERELPSVAATVIPLRSIEVRGDKLELFAVDERVAQREFNVAAQ
jgi:hypothetical protein